MTRTLSRPLARAGGIVALVLMASGVVVASAGPSQAAAKPAAAVAMGDSFISGEAAGSYEPGTDEPGNFCHRSQVAEIHMTTIPGIDNRINLSCSGAKTTNIALGGEAQNGEAPQAERLRAVARDYDVKLIVLTIGANDVGFTPLVLDCIKAYFLIAPRCQDAWAERMPTALNAMAPLVTDNLADIRTVMTEAGYRDTDYQLVLQSYSSPVTEDNRYGLTKLFEGCPVRNDDAQWAREVVVPGFTSVMSQVAAQAGVRFLDLGPSLHGREVCAEGVSHSEEWVMGVNIDLAQIRNGLGINIVRQSMHPNHRGHAQFGRCLTEFAALASTNGTCVRGSDGNLHVQPRSQAPQTGPLRSRTLAREYEPAPPSSRAEAYRRERAAA